MMEISLYEPIEGSTARRFRDALQVANGPVAAGLTTNSKKKLCQMNIEMPLTPELVSLTAQCRVTTRGFGSVEDRE